MRAEKGNSGTTTQKSFSAHGADAAKLYRCHQVSLYSEEEQLVRVSANSRITAPRTELGTR